MKILKSILISVLSTIFILSLFGCSVNKMFTTMGTTKSFDYAADSMYAVPMQANGNASMQMMAKNEAALEIADSNMMDNDVSSERKIIYTVDLSAETKTFDESVAWVQNYVATMSGIIENSYTDLGNRTNPNYRRSANFTIKVPAEKLDSFVSIVSQNVNLTYEYKNRQDITDSYDDTESRKKTLELEENKLNELIKRAQSVDEMIKVEEKLIDVRRELERMTLRLKRYDKQIAYSTVTLNLIEVKELTLGVQKDDFSGSTLLKKLLKNIEDTKLFFIRIAVYIFTHIASIIVSIIFLLIFVLIIRSIYENIRHPKQKKQKKAGKSTTDKTEESKENKIDTAN